MHLMDVLRKSQPARVVVVSSLAHVHGPIVFDDLEWKTRSFGVGMQAYGQSKLANALFAHSLNAKCKAANVAVEACSLHPGTVNTPIFEGMGKDSVLGLVFKTGVSLLGRTIEQGAATPVYCCVTKEIQGGAYYTDCVVGPITGFDEQVAEKLWQISEQRTGTKFQ